MDLVDAPLRPVLLDRTPDRRSTVQPPVGALKEPSDERPDTVACLAVLERVKCRSGLGELSLLRLEPRVLEVFLGDLDKLVHRIEHHSSLGPASATQQPTVRAADGPRRVPEHRGHALGSRLNTRGVWPERHDHVRSQRRLFRVPPRVQHHDAATRLQPIDTLGQSGVLLEERGQRTLRLHEQSQARVPLGPGDKRFVKRNVIGPRAQRVGATGAVEDRYDVADLGAPETCPHLTGRLAPPAPTVACPVDFPGFEPYLGRRSLGLYQLQVERTPDELDLMRHDGRSLGYDGYRGGHADLDRTHQVRG